MLDRANFFSIIRNEGLFASLSAQQVKGIERWLDLWDAGRLSDPRHLAYILATNYWETGRRMWPVVEVGKGKGRPYGRAHAPIASGSKTTVPNSQVYYGRGDPQLTWYQNYALMQELLGYPLVAEPDLMLDPRISAEVTLEGMMRGVSSRGDFTGKALEDYFSAKVDDPMNARRVVNGTDHAADIAAIYQRFLAAAVAAGASPVGQATAPAETLPLPTREEHEEAVSVKPPATTTETAGAWALGAALVGSGLGWKVGVMAAVVAVVVVLVIRGARARRLRAAAKEVAK